LTSAIDAIRGGKDPLPALDRARTLLTDPVSDVGELQSGGAAP
jgi:hypothetical protein